MLKIKDMNLNNVIRQGDTQPREYQLDTGNLDLNLTNKSAIIRLMTADFQGIGYETTATVSSENKISFSIDDVIPARQYRLEVTVDDYVFPSRATDGQLNVDPSSHGQEVNIINVIGVDAVVRKAVDLINDDPNLIIDEDKLVNDIISNTGIGSIEEYYQQFNDVITELSEEKDYHSLPEIAGARGGFDTLGDRLNETTAQLAQKASQDKVWSMANMGQDVKSAMTGGSVAVVGPSSTDTVNLLPKAVTPNRTSFMSESTNIFNHTTSMSGKSINPTTGAIIDSPSNTVSEPIFVTPGEDITTSSNMVRKAFYSGSGEFISSDTLGGTWTVPDGAYILRLVFNNVSVGVNAQANRGGVLLPFEKWKPATTNSEFDLREKSVDARHLKDKSVGLEHANFIERSSNRFNAKTILYGHSLNTAGYGTEDYGKAIENKAYDVSDFISVLPNKVYTHNAFRIFWYDKDKNGINTSTDKTITMPSNATFVRLSIIAGTAGTTQLNESSELLPYEEHYVEVGGMKLNEIDGDKIKGLSDSSFEKNSIRLNRLIDVESSTNLINLRMLEYGKVIPVGSGIPVTNNQYAVTDFIRIDGNQSLSFKDIFRITEYDDNKSYISTINGIGNSTATTNDQTRFIRVSLDNNVLNSSLPTAQLNLSSSLLPYELGGDTIKAGALPHKGVGHDELTDLSLVDEKTSESILFNHTERKLVRTGGDYPLIDTIIPDTFTTNRTYPDMDEVIRNYKSSDIYDLYDDLMAQYPTYISRTLIANESSPSALPVYRYDFKPVVPRTAEYPKPIKILLTSGVHPEVMGVWYLYHFLENVCNNWRDDEYLEAFRFNVHLIVIPVNAPWSYDNNSRVNFNGVDIARNFPAGWNQGEPGYTWGGTEPLTEPEAIAVYDILEQNKDLIAAIDCHNFNGVDGDYDFLWGATGNIFSRNVMMNHIQKMDRKWKKEYEFMSQDLDKFIGNTGGYSPGGSLGRQADAFGIKGALTYETGNRLRSDIVTPYTGNVMTLSYEAFTNFMGMFLRELINTW